MKKSFLMLTLAIFTFFDANIFAASGDSLTGSETGFQISEANVSDDRNIEFTFNAPLAEEPVEIKIIRKSDGSEIGIEETKVDQTRTRVSLKLIETLKKGESYGYYIASALSEKGDKINQEKEKAEDLEIPSSVALSEDEAKEEDIDESMKDAFDDVRANPESAGETVTEGLDSAPAVSTGSKTDVMPASQNPVQPQNDISIQNSKQLPKTGPAENILILTALAIGASILYFRKTRIKG